MGWTRRTTARENTLTSLGVSEYSFTLSTAMMLVSKSLDIRTIQFSVLVSWEGVRQDGSQQWEREGVGERTILRKKKWK